MENQVTQQNGKTFSEWMRILLTAFFSKQRPIIVIPILAGLFATIVCFTFPPVYEGSFSLLVLGPEIDKARLGGNANIVMRPGVIEENIISDEIYILQSQSIYQKIADKIQDKKILDQGYFVTAVPDSISGIFSGLLETVKSSLSWQDKDQSQSQENKSPDRGLIIASLCSIAKLTGSDVIEVHVKHHNMKLLKEILDLYIETYFNFRKEVWFNKDALKLYEKQKEKYFEAWQTQLQELIDFKDKSNLIEPVAGKKKLQEKLITFRAEIVTLKTELTKLLKRKEMLAALPARNSITFLSEKTEKDNLFRKLKEQIGLVRIQRSNKLSSFKDQTSIIQKTDFQLNLLYKEYKQLLLGYLDGKITENRIKLASLIQVLNENHNKFYQLCKDVNKITAMEDDINLNRQQYLEHRKKEVEENLQQSMRNTAAKVKIIAAPYIADRPSWPNKPVLILLSMLLTFLLVNLYMIVLQILDDSFYLPEDVTHELKLPVLASFALIKGKQKSKIFGNRKCTKTRRAKSLPIESSKATVAVITFILILSAIIVVLDKISLKEPDIALASPAKTEYQDKAIVPINCAVAPNFFLKKVKPVVADIPKQQINFGQPEESLPYVIMTGSFKEIDNLKKEVSIYRAKGIPVHWHLVDQGRKGKLYRLFTGRFETKSDAVEYKDAQALRGSMILLAPMTVALKYAGTPGELAVENSIKKTDHYDTYIVKRADRSYLLCAGIFITLKGADSFASELRKQGFNAEIVCM